MFFEHQIISNKRLNNKFRLLCIKSKYLSFHHKIGQFVTIKITDQVFRCYSIASLPVKLPYWEIFVDITPGGPGTRYLKTLKKNDTITTSKPVGDFYLAKKEKNYIFGTVGCGIAPLIPMIEKLVQYKNKNIFLFWGLRNEKEIVLKKRLRQLSKENNNLNISIFISKPGKGYHGKKGHITPSLVKQIRQIPTENSIVYLSGSGTFVNQTMEKLINYGFPITKIKHEACY